MLETPDLRDLLPHGGTPLTKQLARDVTDALRDTSIPASTRLKNAAVLLTRGLIEPQVENGISQSVLHMQQLIMMSAGFIPASTLSSTTWTELSSIIKQCANIFIDQVKDEIKNTFRAEGEAETVLHEATVDPTSKEAVRFARKQSLICQVLIACSDVQTMTGMCLTRNDVG